MNIENALSDEELQKRFDALCAINPVVQMMTKGLVRYKINPKTAREYIDQWFAASRKDLLQRLSIKEHESYKGIYLDVEDKAPSQRVQCKAWSDDPLIACKQGFKGLCPNKPCILTIV
jgi:hypothetical protein